jgi:hypothetical protein
MSATLLQPSTAWAESAPNEQAHAERQFVAIDLPKVHAKMSEVLSAILKECGSGKKKSTKKLKARVECYAKQTEALFTHLAEQAQAVEPTLKMVQAQAEIQAQSQPDGRLTDQQVEQLIALQNAANEVVYFLSYLANGAPWFDRCVWLATPRANRPSIFGIAPNDDATHAQYLKLRFLNHPVSPMDFLKDREDSAKVAEAELGADCFVGVYQRLLAGLALAPAPTQP